MSSNTNHTTFVSRFKYLVVAGQLYRISRVHGTTTVSNTSTNTRQRFYSAESFAHFINTLTAAGERIAAEWRVASLILYIVANRKPAPAPEPIAAVCAGYGNHHWNLPAELQRTPATVFVGGKALCAHCAAAHDRALAHLARLQSEAATPALNYITYAEAA